MKTIEEVKTERVFKNGNSKAISLSKQTSELLSLNIGDKVEVKKVNDGLLITKKESSLEEELKEFYKNGGKYKEAETNFGESVGREEL